jgi:hypothetical protein
MSRITRSSLIPQITAQSGWRKRTASSNDQLSEKCLLLGSTETVIVPIPTNFYRPENEDIQHQHTPNRRASDQASKVQLPLGGKIMATVLMGISCVDLLRGTGLAPSTMLVF